jgi:hypothetical protein
VSKIHEEYFKIPKVEKELVVYGGCRCFGLLILNF